MKRPQYVQDSISIDEIGVHTGRYGPYFLRSAYQPIYCIADGKLIPRSVEGLIKVQGENGPVPPVRFFESVDIEDRLFIESMCRALHLRNFHHVQTQGMKLFFNFNPTSNANLKRSLVELQYMMTRLPILGIDPVDLVCEITESHAFDSGTLRGLVKEFRRNGIRIAVDDYGTEFSNIERVEAISPDIVKFDGEWFRQLASVPSAQRLIDSMVRNFTIRGVNVLIEGIETPEQLSAAIDAGAGQVQGFLLAEPQDPAADFCWKPREVEEVLFGRSNVVPLRAASA